MRAARAEYRASTERVRQAGVLPDPKLSAQCYLEPVETRTGPQNASFSLTQVSPGSISSLLHELSDHEAAISGAKMAAVELNLARQVKEAYIEYGFLGQSQQTVLDNVELLRYLEGVARSQSPGENPPILTFSRFRLNCPSLRRKVKPLPIRPGR